MIKKVVFILTLLILSLITGCNRFPDLRNGYKLEYNGMNDVQIENSENTVIVNGHILDYAFDSTFILAAQRPRDSVPGLETMTFKNYEEAFEKSTFKQYWIIDKTKESVFDETTKTYSNVYGPFKKSKYLQKREKLKVPKELELKE